MLAHKIKNLTQLNQRPLLGLLIVQLLNGTSLMPSGNFITIYLNELMAYPVLQVAQVIAWGQICGMLASLVGGGLSDRWGHKKVLILGIMSITISSLVYIFRVPWLIVVFWGIAGAGLGFSTLSSQSYLTLAAGIGTLGVFSALYNWGYTLGGVIGNPIAAFIIERCNFFIFGLSLLAFGVLATLVASFLPNQGAEKVEIDHRRRPHSYRQLFRRELIILGMLRFLPTCYYGVMTLLPLLIKQQGGSNTNVAWYAAVSALLASLAQLLAGRVSDRRGMRLPTVAAFIMILVAIAGTIAFAQSLWGLYIFGTLGVSAAWALSTLLPGLVRLAAEPIIHGRVFGTLHFLWTSAMIFGTLLGGTLLEIDFRLPFIIVGLLNILALTLTWPFFNFKISALQTVS
jgi:MFS family permease